MRRVVILGAGGSGKSELARAIGERTGLPVVHLDVLFYLDDWKPAPRAEAVARLAARVDEESWIIDGNFLSTVDEDGRVRRADTVIFLDLPRILSLTRVLWRWLRDRNRRRADLPERSDESFDPEGMRWIWNYRCQDRPEVLELLAGLADDVTVHHLRSRSDVRKLLDSLVGL